MPSYAVSGLKSMGILQITEEQRCQKLVQVHLYERWINDIRRSITWCARNSERARKLGLCSLVNCWALCEQYLLSCLPSWGRLSVHCRTGPAEGLALWYWPGCGLVVLCKWERASSLSGLRPALTKNRLAGWVNYKSWAGPPTTRKYWMERN